jgi:hypothetical protein
VYEKCALLGPKQNYRAKSAGLTLAFTSDPLLYDASAQVSIDQPFFGDRDSLAKSEVLQQLFGGSRERLVFEDPHSDEHSVRQLYHQVVHFASSQAYCVGKAQRSRTDRHASKRPAGRGLERLLGAAGVAADATVVIGDRKHRDGLVAQRMGCAPTFSRYDAPLFAPFLTT